ncbi:MAG: fibronectin type III domain-containing protein, partial [Gaiellales bacterium]
MIVTCVLAMLPLAAFGDAPEPTQVPTEVQQAAETRMEIDELNAQAIDDAPKDVGETCRQTLEVDGIGDSCVTRDGLLRVEQADGRSHTIHGLDAPPVGVATYAPGSQAAVDGAGIGDIACVTAPQPRYVLVYAHPANVASRYASIAPKLQSELYKVSAFIDSESQSITPGASRTVPVACDAGGPVVLNLALDGLSAGTAGFGDIVDGLRAKGLEFNGDGSNSERYIVYYDSPSPTRAAGTGHVFASDASAGATNSNNTGGLYAVEYRFDGGGSVPHWEVMIHEVLHTMGAVVSTAPNTSGLVGTVGAGHCIDGLDIMCYNDGGSRGGSYTETTCPTKVLDCNRDDYFHPSPPAGSFLATHWNVAATYNRFLISGGATRAPRALAPTASISNLRQSGASNAAVGLTWNASGGTSYVVGIRQPNGSWKDVLTTSERTATIAGLSARRSYEIGVGVSDSTDRVS